MPSSHANVPWKTVVVWVVVCELVGDVLAVVELVDVVELLLVLDVVVVEVDDVELVEEELLVLVLVLVLVLELVDVDDDEVVVLEALLVDEVDVLCKRRPHQAFSGAGQHSEQRCRRRGVTPPLGV